MSDKEKPDDLSLDALGCLNVPTSIFDRVNFVVLLVASSLLVACATATDKFATGLLAGSRWQLITIQSMDDAQGTTRIGDPARFTLQFGADGHATMQLDCNRGMGSFEASPASDGTSGSLTFGPVAATRAMCPPPHLDERVARQLPYVRSYLFKDGRLYLSLMADGGILEWQPAPASE